MQAALGEGNDPSLPEGVEDVSVDEAVWERAALALEASAAPFGDRAAASWARVQASDAGVGTAYAAEAARLLDGMGFTPSVNARDNVFATVAATVGPKHPLTAAVGAATRRIVIEDEDEEEEEDDMDEIVVVQSPNKANAEVDDFEDEMD